MSRVFSSMPCEGRSQQVDDIHRLGQQDRLRANQPDGYTTLGSRRQFHSEERDLAARSLFERARRGKSTAMTLLHKHVSKTQQL